MRLLQVSFLPLVLLLPAGCGTFCNLKAPPKGLMYAGTGACYPFGGVTRSGLLSVGGPFFGVGGIISGNVAICQGNFSDGFEEIGNGILLTSAGLGAIADAPLSLVGDIVTFPVAYARSNEYSWATWWGEKSLQYQSMPFSPASEEWNETPDDSIEPSVQTWSD